MDNKIIVCKPLSDEHFQLSITVPPELRHNHMHKVEFGEADYSGSEETRPFKYTFILTRQEMESLARNSLGAFSPRVEIPNKP